MVVSSTMRSLHGRYVKVTSHAPPPSYTFATRPPHRATIEDVEEEPLVPVSEEEMIEQARGIVMKEMRAVLERDIGERLVGLRVRELVDEERAKKREKAEAERKERLMKGVGAGPELGAALRGLSFKKKRPRESGREEGGKTLGGAEGEGEAEEAREKKAKRRKVVLEEVESEDEQFKAPEQEQEPEPEPEPEVQVEAPEPEIVSKKRPKELDEDEKKKPPTKKRKISEDVTSEETLVGPPVKAGKAKRKEKQLKAKKVVRTRPREVEEEEEEDVLLVTHVKDAPSPSLLDVVDISSPSPEPYPSPTPTPVPPSLDPFALSLCADDEDFYFAKAAVGPALGLFEPPPSPTLQPVPGLRVHATGSARTEGTYKIPHQEKAAYVQSIAARVEETRQKEKAQAVGASHHHHVVMSSRSNRANARGQARGVEDLNRALALSLVGAGLSSSASSHVNKFNQLQTRKKQLRFSRSPIHDWGLYAMERIVKGEMVIEYVGELIRQAVADKREKAYERQGIGSSYLFRVDDEVVVDATKKGNLG